MVGKAGEDAGQDVPDRDLQAEVAALRAEIEALAARLSAIGGKSHEAGRLAASLGVDGLRARGDAALAGIQAEFDEVEERLTRKVREKPFTALAVAAGVGYLLALLSRR